MLAEKLFVLCALSRWNEGQVHSQRLQERHEIHSVHLQKRPMEAYILQVRF